MEQLRAAGAMGRALLLPNFGAVAAGGDDPWMRLGSSFPPWQPEEDVSRVLSRRRRSGAEGLLIASDVSSNSAGASNNCYWKHN